MSRARTVLGIVVLSLIASLLIVLTASVTCVAEPPEGPVEPVGQTPRETGWKALTVVGGLDHPWSLVWLPDRKTMLVTEREGRLRVIQDGRLRNEPVQGVPDVLAIHQGGLLDIALHPRFAANRLVYMTYATGQPKANRTALARGRIDDGLTRLTDVEQIFRVDQTKPGGQHFGSRLLWLADGTLLMSVGDGGNPPVRLQGRLIRQFAQDLSSQLGKVLRMDADGKPPADNPWAGDDDPNTNAYIWTYGHRNIQGLALRPAGGEVWASEHGSRGGDELNVLRKGGNYGWPKATYSVEYFGPRISDKTTIQGAIGPRVVWTPCIAPSGLTFYTGDEFPHWKGDLLAGGLVLRQIRRVHFRNGRIVGQTTLQFDDRIRWVGQGPDGGLYALTDETDGRLLRIVPADRR